MEKTITKKVNVRLANEKLILQRKLHQKRLDLMESEDRVEELENAIKRFCKDLGLG